MAKGKSRDRAKERLWRWHVRAQQASGQSVREYCREHGLSEPGFYWWRQELGRRAGEALARGSRERAGWRATKQRGSRRPKGDGSDATRQDDAVGRRRQVVGHGGQATVSHRVGDDCRSRRTRGRWVSDVSRDSAAVFGNTQNARTRVGGCGDAATGNHRAASDRRRGRSRIGGPSNAPHERAASSCDDRRGRARVGGRSDAPACDAPRFAEVQMVVEDPSAANGGEETSDADAAEHPVIEVCLAGGRTIRVGRRFDGATFLRVVGLLEGSRRC